MCILDATINIFEGSIAKKLNNIMGTEAITVVISIVYSSSLLLPSSSSDWRMVPYGGWIGPFSSLTTKVDHFSSLATKLDHFSSLTTNLAHFFTPNSVTSPALTCGKPMIQFLVRPCGELLYIPLCSLVT